MKYLIMKCEELGDQFECDANRIPTYITDDWKENYPKDYLFEVYEILEDNTLKLIKNYDNFMESGMYFGYWTEDEECVVIQKFPNQTRDYGCPQEIYNKLKKINDDIDDSLECCGYINTCDYDNNFTYCYAEYYDSCFSMPY